MLCDWATATKLFKWLPMSAMQHSYYHKRYVDRGMRFKQPFEVSNTYLEETRLSMDRIQFHLSVEKSCDTCKFLQ